jgi:hypothetical protein
VGGFSLAELQEQQVIGTDKQAAQAKKPASVWIIWILDIVIFCLTLLAAREFYWTGGHDLEAVLIVLVGICYLVLGIFCFRTAPLWALASQGVISLALSAWYTRTIVAKAAQVIQYYNAAHFDTDQFKFYIKEMAFSYGPWWIANLIIFVLALILFIKALKAKRGPKVTTKAKAKVKARP